MEDVWIMIVMFAGLYFLPAIVAYSRKKRNAGAILALNILLGWTLLGWIVALVWGMTHDHDQPASK